MNVTFGTTPISPPASARQTEITTYMWSGFLGELDHSSQTFQAWEIRGPSTWVLRPDILVPPYTCIGIEKNTIYTWHDKGYWTLQGNIWRNIRP